MKVGVILSDVQTQLQTYSVRKPAVPEEKLVKTRNSTHFFIANKLIKLTYQLTVLDIRYARMLRVHLTCESEHRSEINCRRHSGELIINEI